MTRARPRSPNDEHVSTGDPVQWSVSTGSADATRELGRLLGELAQPGTVVLLSGELGAGKTVFAQGVGAGLSTPGVVNSPTFVLVNEHLGGRLPLLHADLYRLSESGEVEELALHEVALDGVLLVEWPERAPGMLPTDRIILRIENGADPDQRSFLWSATGACASAVLRGVRVRSR